MCWSGAYRQVLHESTKFQHSEGHVFVPVISPRAQSIWVCGHGSVQIQRPRPRESSAEPTEVGLCSRHFSSSRGMANIASTKTWTRYVYVCASHFVLLREVKDGHCSSTTQCESGVSDARISSPASFRKPSARRIQTLISMP